MMMTRFAVGDEVDDVEGSPPCGRIVEDHVTEMVGPSD